MLDKVSEYQIKKYAILTILSESRSGINMDELAFLTGFDKKSILNVVSRLITWRDIRSISSKDEPKIYRITDHGIDKQKHFKIEKKLGQYWIPPWEK